MSTMITAAEVKQWIEEGLQDTQADIRGEDGQHFSGLIISRAFEGHPMLARHRIVYQALKDHMKNDIHALSLKTYTAEEYSEIQRQKVNETVNEKENE